MNSELPNNFLLINKPAGWTSFDAVNYVRKKARIETGDKKIRVGHAGTLDPFATGLLIVGVGREATKRLDEFKKLPKTYVAKLRLGAVSDTYDVAGVIKEQGERVKGKVSDNEILSVLEKFKGKQLQLPPMYSAKKIGGERLYKLARQGKEVEREPVMIEIFDIKILEYYWPHLTIEVACAAGTYIRSLAHDIGEKLGVGAYCEELVRTRIGDYKLEDAREPGEV
ncbi:MAG: tRNA pseudouridine(55) synthase TruB [Candidatus Magasanikbacteria bacterium RIFCSPHIGHO2_01_FULL_47_8]|uniref:tRNA pseudouridine synthase B n=1 Tax=Candidatus Magasanikbacteria bacterium RIFCSPHIGHO2_01_FULL_47_8 TaxID=1798673 RepID=A0A1F6ME26_9BACT|nr:MAG: tRNA pseudouridine(55) synthase TruB [Candidatus Magasanikbacteria bacterium RIFCSPHIGHO2_01_FULL_47_8]